MQDRAKANAQPAIVSTFLQLMPQKAPNVFLGAATNYIHNVDSAVKSRLLRARLQLRERLTRLFKRKGEDVFAYL